MSASKLCYQVSHEGGQPPRKNQQRARPPFVSLPPTGNFDRNGVPILTNERIEGIAESFLAAYDSSCLARAERTSVDLILSDLVETHSVKFTTGNLGAIEGQKIRGWTDFKKNEIAIDGDLVYPEMENLYRFTAAHEIGHWVLHRHRPIDLTPVSDFIRDTEKNFEGKKNLSSPRDWVEHHANRFAAALLMPRRAFQKSVIEEQERIGVLRNLGIVYLDGQHCNLCDFAKLYDRIHLIFGVSKTAFRYRLSDLRMLVEPEKETSVHISQLGWPANIL